MKVKATKNGKPADKVVGKTVKTSKLLVKPSVKPIPKAAVKTAAKPVAEAVKVSRKPVKVAALPSGKKPAPVSKPKPTPEKPLTKPTTKSTAKKPILKVTAKVPSRAMVKTAEKSMPKSMPTAKSKTILKNAGKAAVQLAPKVKTVALAATAKLQTAANKKPEKTPVLPAVVVPVVPVKALVSSNGLPPPPPLKPGRRSSSRALAHMPPPAPMVPTHAPDAAKASYSTMTERVIAPPPHVAAKKDPKLANNWKTKTPHTLTDEEVKAMPDAEYMNDMQMAFFRHRLSILKQDIHNSAGATTEHLREDTTVVPDPADRATIEEEHALELRTRDRERKLLKKIEQSIGRIDSGDYGYCDETGEPIGVGRLIARPTASLSLEAQQRRELKQKMFGD